MRVTSFNSIKSVRYVRGAEQITAAIGSCAYANESAGEAGYVVVLADCTVFVPSRLLREARVKRASSGDGR